MVSEHGERKLATPLAAGVAVYSQFARGWGARAGAAPGAVFTASRLHLVPDCRRAGKARIAPDQESSGESRLRSPNEMGNG